MKKLNSFTVILLVGFMFQKVASATESISSGDAGGLGGLSLAIGTTLLIVGVTEDQPPLIYSGAVLFGGAGAITLGYYLHQDDAKKNEFLAMRTDLLEYERTGNLSLPLANYFHSLRENVKEVAGFDNPTLARVLEGAEAAFLSVEGKNAQASNQLQKSGVGDDVSTPSFAVGATSVE